MSVFDPKQTRAIYKTEVEVGVFKITCLTLANPKLSSCQEYTNWTVVVLSLE